MARGLTTAVKNELATKNINSIHLVNLNLGSKVLRLNSTDYLKLMSLI